MIYYPLTPYKGALWSPLSLSNQVYWYRGDSIKLSGGSIDTAYQKFPSGFGINANFAGTLPVSNGLPLNGQPSMDFDSTSTSALTSPSSTQVVDSSGRFTLAYVAQSPTLALGTFYRLINLSGSSATDSPALFYTNLTGAPTFYLQIGNGAVDIVGATFPVDVAHSVVLTYDGGGYANASSWTLLVNGVAQTITVTSAGGGGVMDNSWGDASGGGASPPFYYYEMLLVGDNSAGNLSNLVNYLNLRYGV